MYARNYTQGHLPREINGAPARDHVPFSLPEPVLIPDNYHGELLRSAERKQPDPQKEDSHREDSHWADSRRENSHRDVSRQGDSGQKSSAEEREPDGGQQREPSFSESGRTFPGTLLEGKEDTLLLCAVGLLLFAGQSREAGWREEDLALLLILLLLIT